MALISASWATDALVLLFTVLVGLYYYSTKNFDYWKKRGVAFLKPMPLFGNFYDCISMKTPIGEYLADLYNKIDEPFFGIFILNQPVLVVKCPELLKSILVKDFNYFQDRTILSNERDDPMTSHMMFFAKNPKWKAIRSKLTPVFTSGKMKNMFPLINEAGQAMNSYIRNKCLDKESVEAKEICAKYSTNVITSCAFGIDARCFENEDEAFRKVGRKMFEFSTTNAFHQTSFFFLPKIATFLKMQFFHPFCTNFLRDVFWKTIDAREQSNVKRNDLIDIIIQLRKKEDLLEGVKFESDMVVAQAAQFFTAGFETTSSTIAFTLYELCLNKDIQNKVRNEINEQIENHGGLTYEAVQSMSYLQNCISETLRKYPVLPFLDRVCMEDYKIPNSDVVIEKGIPVYVPMFGLHLDPNYFPDPQKYDPDRFMEEKIKERPQFCYIPFGEGPRNCIGERFGLLGSKLGVIKILTEFEVERSKDTPVPLVFEKKSFVVASEVGLPMKFKKLSIS